MLTENDLLNISAVNLVTVVFPFVPVIAIVNGDPITFLYADAIRPRELSVFSQIIWGTFIFDVSILSLHRIEDAPFFIDSWIDLFSSIGYESN